MSKPNAVAGQQGPPAQKHITDNLKSQLSVILVQMGRIIKAQVPDQDRADFIVEHARKQVIEATDSFHSTLDDMEIEITRAKAVFLRDLELLRGKQQQQQSTQPAAAPAHIAPPAPMVIDLDGFRPSGPAVPVAPMMATGGSPIVATHGVPKTEGKPVAPFPDMGAPVIPPQKPVSAVPFARVKASPVEQKRPSPKQIKQPTPKLSHNPAPKTPASAKMSNKPNPMAKAPRPPATAPPAAAAVAPAPMMAVAPAAPMAPVVAAQPQPPAPAPMSANAPHFTNATFTLDPPPNNDAMMQSSAAGSNLDMPMIDMDTFGTDAAGGAGDASNDTAMDDLDHFFDLGGDSSNANADPSEFNSSMDDYMNADFNFDDF